LFCTNIKKKKIFLKRKKEKKESNLKNTVEDAVKFLRENIDCCILLKHGYENNIFPETI